MSRSAPRFDYTESLSIVIPMNDFNFSTLLKLLLLRSTGKSLKQNCFFAESNITLTRLFAIIGEKMSVWNETKLIVGPIYKLERKKRGQMEELETTVLNVERLSLRRSMKDLGPWNGYR